MKIRILTNCYPPEIGAAANQLYELAQALTAKGHAVSVVSRFPRHISEELQPKTKGKWVTREKRPEAEVVRVKIPHFPRSIPLMRELEHLINIILLVWASLLGKRPEVTLVYSPPIVVGYAAVLARLFNKSKVILNVQDLFPQSFIDVGIIKNRLLIVICRFFEKDLYRRVNMITVHSENNARIVEETVGDKNKVKVVPNWVDTDYIIPGNHDNKFRKEFGLENKFIISFAGCMGEGQDLDLILDCADKLRDNDHIVFLLAGNGPKYDYVKNRAQGMNNVRVLPIQPREKYVNLLAASNVCIVTLSKLINTPVVPSKILSIMSSGRPLLASLPDISDAVAIIRKADCGICVNAADAEAFTSAVIRLYKDVRLLSRYGENGRKFVTNHFSLESCAVLYEKSFKEVVDNGR